MTDKPTTNKEVQPAATHSVRPIVLFFDEAGRLAAFSMRFFKEAFKPPFEWSALVKQSFIVGYKSMPLIAITGLIMGLVMTIQSRPTLAQFGAESWLPAMVSISIIRELGPVIAALIFAGKVGSGIGAELASMKVTEQIDAMEVSGANPFKLLVVTRVAATTIMLPVLVVAANAFSLFGAYLGVNLKGSTSLHLFMIQVFASLSFSDVFPALIKTFFFGFSIGIIGCYKGYNAVKGTEGVGAAANSAVVTGSLAVFIIDMIAVQLTSIFI